MAPSSRSWILIALGAQAYCSWLWLSGASCSVTSNSWLVAAASVGGSRLWQCYGSQVLSVRTLSSYEQLELQLSGLGFCTLDSYSLAAAAPWNSSADWGCSLSSSILHLLLPSLYFCNPSPPLPLFSTVSALVTLEFFIHLLTATFVLLLPLLWPVAATSS
jgi:hypothetical protein